MADKVTVIGSPVSPYVRKVLVCLDLKGIACEIDPVVGFFGDERFTKLNPLRRIPVLLHDDFALVDSSVICQYIEDRWPEPRLYPADIRARARARWLEEYADTRMGDVLIWNLFAEIAVKPATFGEKGDRAKTARVVAEDVPAIFDWLEGEAPAEGWLCGALSIADITIACFLRNAQMVRVEVDPARWPRLAALAQRAFALPAFARLRTSEDALMRTPILQQRQALAALGVALTAESMNTPTARRGPMSPA